MITLVACCGPKLSTSAPAKDLYVSTLFKKARRYAEATNAPWLILSALHGVVEPEAILAPYNVKLANGADGWGWLVYEQLSAKKLRDETFTVLAGAKYTDPLTVVGLKLVTPMVGMGIGEQLQWLTKKV